MKTLLPGSFVYAFLLILIQTYLLVYFSLLLLRLLKLLKRPYGGMDYAEILPAALILLGVLIISVGNAPGIFQAAKFYADTGTPMTESLLLFFARSFFIVFLFNIFFIALNYLNLRFLFRAQYTEPALSVSLLLSAIAIGTSIVFWLCCKEIIDNMTPKFINFQ